MGVMVEGEWREDWYEPDEDGRFVRPDTVFHGRLGSPEHPVEAGRYRLYVSYACPWAHRTLLVRALLGLEDALPVTVVDPIMLEDGWRFGHEGDTEPLYGLSFLRELYQRADNRYTGRVTVPVLWDTKAETIVNNESRELIRMLGRGFGANSPLDLCPSELESEINDTISAIYEPINNGVYRAGFATSQSAYDEAVNELFQALDRWDAHLAERRWLVGNRFTEADICLFTTLVRFDPVYVAHFKCNLRRIADYPNLSGYVRDIWQLPGVAETCDLHHIKAHYFRSHPMINPTGIVPAGPVLDHDQPAHRAHLGDAPIAGHAQRG